MYDYRINWNADHIIKISASKMEVALNRICLNSIREMKVDMQSPKHGTPVGKRKGALTPRTKRKNIKASSNARISGRNKQVTTRSAPGEAPAVQQSILLRSLTFMQPGPLLRRIGTGVEAYYGRYLEPDTGIGLQNRPFLLKNVVKALQAWLDKQR